jgi:predicted acylesterase/phospholipase RssA
LATKYDNGEPRLLVISVDVLDGAAVAFDSYSNESKYGRYDEESEQYQEHTIRYEKGIMPIHVMASGAFPVYFNFRWVPKDYDYNNAGGEESEEFGFREDSRPFWDGGVLSNTPLRELISEHKLFWEKRIGDTKLKKDMWKGEEEREEDDSQKVPGLEVFIVNVWPKRETRIPSDHDEVKDRKNDIAYCDKTEYDQKVAVLVSDYIEIIRQMRNFSLDYIPQNKQNNFKDKLDEFLERQHAESKNRKGEPRTYEELLKGRFKITSVATIERTDDVNDISNKWADFSEDSIIRLINKGIEDAKRVHIL